jgi:hypothetical protein
LRGHEKRRTVRVERDTEVDARVEAFEFGEEVAFLLGVEPGGSGFVSIWSTFEWHGSDTLALSLVRSTTSQPDGSFPIDVFVVTPSSSRDSRIV